MYRQQNRAASAIVLTLAITLLVFGMVGLATTRLRTLHQLTDYDTGVQQATAAAEAITSFRETKLVELAATNDLALLTVHPITQSPDDPWEGMDWFANCIVRWRVEPVRIAAEDGRFITNPFLFGVNAAMQADPDYLENHEYYHYRINAEAHYLRDRNLVSGSSLSDLEAAGELPWQNIDNSVCAVRATRVVQLQLNSLFKYALFHAKEGPYGDIEIGPGYDQNISGRVHSNGGIYIAGGGIRYNPSGWGAALIGSAAEPVDMVGINGIYRLRKDTLLAVHRYSGDPNGLYVPPGDPEWGDKVWFGDGNQDPLPVDNTYPVPVGSNLDDQQSNPDHQLNGISLKYWNDSRSKDPMQATFGAHLRDSFNSGATVVKTLSNIPQLGGRPFEPQRLFAEGTQIWTTDPGNPGDIRFWTILPNDGFRPADRYVDPEGLDGDSSNDFDFTDGGGVDARPVVQSATRLYHIADPRNRKVAGSSYSASDPSINVDVDVDGDGVLDNSGVVYDEDWFVDAGGLRQFYQRLSPTVGKHVVNGSDTSAVSLSLVDIFDPVPTWDANPKPLGPGDALSADQLSPGDAGFRYNGASTLDSDGDSFGDNEVQGTYLNWAMHSKDDAENAGKFGLVIRERRYQKIPDGGSTDDWTVKPDRPVYNGGGVKVQLHRGGGASGADWTVADAIKFTEVNTGEEIIIDTEDPGYSEYPTTASAWGDIGQPNYYGTSKSRRTKTSGAYAQWLVNLPPGEYRLETFFSTHGNARDETAYYTVEQVVGGPYTSPPISMQNPGNGADPHGGEGFYDFQGRTFEPEAGAFDYAKYMKSQYVVYFGEHDITDMFFSYDVLFADSDDDFIAYERDVLDRREAVFMQYQFWNQDSGFPNNYWRSNYMCSILTLNMRKCLDFLMETDYAAINPGYTGGAQANEFFNGMIYAHRTRRSDDYTPWDTTRWHPDCYGIWNRSGFVNYRLPLAGHRPNVDLPSTVWPAKSFDWRTGSGPAMTFHSAIRLTNAADLDYGIYYTADQGTATPSDDYQTKKGLTVITPNMCYVWGDYNTVKYGDSDFSGGLGARAAMGDSDYNNSDMKNVPAAIFADYINILSNDWVDEDQAWNAKRDVLGDVWMISSVITNNIPSHVDGHDRIHSSEGSHNLIRYNEDWDDSPRKTFHLKGSNVVMNTRRYSRSHIAYKYEAPNLNTDVYDPPDRDFVMNSDLFTKPGQPPFTPFGVTVTRTVSTIEDLNN